MVDPTNLNPRFLSALLIASDSGDVAGTSARLAQLLKTQGKYERAIDMYQKLISKNPEKSTFFASQIELIKDLNR